MRAWDEWIGSLLDFFTCGAERGGRKEQGRGGGEGGVEVLCRLWFWILMISGKLYAAKFYMREGKGGE